MFREMRRNKQQITEAECIQVLTDEKRGVLSVIGEDGYPYGMPMNFWFDPEDGHIYFHGAKAGHKIDAIRANNKVCFTVFEKEGYQDEGDWPWNVKSVVIFGTIHEVTDPEKAWRVTECLGHKYTTEEDYVERTLQKHMPNVLNLELIPDHMTGKLVNES
ncbi:MAG: pyridoxamine 5'-phosphate oxidase family protein [Clostridiales bacterium]|nr:pyridoxamine 5'-phosphate oxidase family protein [Candidatus Blautia equi]